MLDTGLRIAGDFRTVCYVEREAFACSQLVALMEAGCLDVAPVWADLATFDGKPWRGKVDCIIGGLPCQPYSVAGKRVGNDDERSWGDGDGPIPNALRIIDEVRPAVVFFENVPAWITGGFFQPVAEALSSMGYGVQRPLFVAAEDVGASHKRERVFVAAYREGERLGEARRHCERTTQWTGARGAELADAMCARSQGSIWAGRIDEKRRGGANGSTSQRGGLFAPGPNDPRWAAIIRDRPDLAPATQPGVRLLASGIAAVVDESRRHQLRAIGNGCVPLAVALAFSTLAEEAGILSEAA